MKVEKIHVGGWFQRTSLHLSEIYDFLKEAHSPLDLDQGKLKELHAQLSLKEVLLHVGELDRIELVTKENIHVDIYEDGLIILGTDTDKGGDYAKERIALLTTYYEKRLSPALSHLFSLGAPIPKELANIKTIYPYFVVVKSAKEKHINAFLASFKEEKHFEVRTSGYDIFRGNKLYIINRKKVSPEAVKRLIEEQIFIREFKGQLHRYLNLHRSIWERIAEGKERGEIKGKDVREFNTKIESYAKTINLIGARINQMNTYLSTRAAIVGKDAHMKEFGGVLEFKHETLSDTLSYVKEIWAMTKNYVDSAKEVFSAIQAKSTEASVKNLTVITSMGVGATLIGLFAQKVPEFTLFGLFYFIALVVIGWSANSIMSFVAKQRMYKIEDVEVAKDL